jgi:probable HAF family extracellular repeat protein
MILEVPAGDEVSPTRSLTMRRLQIAAAFGIILLMSWPGVQVLHSDLPLYTIEDLGTLNGAPLTPRAINAGGHVAGMADAADGSRVAFLIDAQPARNLGSLGGSYTEANALNDADEVVGFSVGSDGMLHAFRYAAASGIQPLATTAGSTSVAFGINEAGQIAGYGGAGVDHAFRSSRDGVMIDLGTLGGPASYGYGINAAGQVTGCSWTAGGQMHAFVATGPGDMQDLGTLGGMRSCGVSINRTGQVAGSSFLVDDMFQHAFRYSTAGGLQDLGTLGGTDSAATAINDEGTVVGWSTTASGDRHAFVFTDADGLIDLNSRVASSLGWTIVEASGINATGQITGVGLLGGTPHAFRLTPPPKPAPPPPPTPPPPTPPADRTPPVIAWARPWPTVLWPPLHEMIPVWVKVSASDNVDAAPACRILRVTSSEPDAGTHNQDRPRDILLKNALTLLLRAELAHQSRERIYTITVTCADSAGNTATADTTVRVVKNPWQMYR